MFSISVYQGLSIRNKHYWRHKRSTDDSKNLQGLKSSIIVKFGAEQ